jgi:HEAT repeat protein
MNLLSLLRPSLSQQIARLRKKVKEPHGDPATRINAGRRLIEIGNEEALLALLERFTISASPSRQDDEEKDEFLRWVVAKGEHAVPALVRFLKRERQVYWPFRALRSILPPDRLAETVEQLLRYHWENPPADPDPTAQIIRSAEGLHTETLEKTIALFLANEDDDTCLAAVDYLFKRNEEEAREKILQTYLDAEERPRIRAHILERLAESGWSVRGFRPRIEETLPDGYVLTRDGTVKLMGRRA